MIGLDHNVTNIKESRLQLCHDFLYKQFWGAYFSNTVIEEEPHGKYLLIKHFENEPLFESWRQIMIKLWLLESSFCRIFDGIFYMHHWVIKNVFWKRLVWNPFHMLLLVIKYPWDREKHIFKLILFFDKHILNFCFFFVREDFVNDGRKESDATELNYHDKNHLFDGKLVAIRYTIANCCLGHYYEVQSLFVK